MKNAEYCQEAGCAQRDSAEHKEYAGAQNTGTQEVGETDGTKLLEAVLISEKLNNAYQRLVPSTNRCFKTAATATNQEEAPGRPLKR